MRRGEERDRGLAGLEEALGYRFRDRELLHRALVHRSWFHEAEDEPASNEPLEFLGDAVLGFLVAERILRRRPDLDEGGMTRLRASLVNTRSLAREARALGLGEHLLLGKGEDRSGGRKKPTILADTFEAIVGAIYLDGGIRPARSLVRRLFGQRIDTLPGPAARTGDPKTRLQEWLQGRGRPLPVYRVVDSRGPDHDREYTVEVLVEGRPVARGDGSAIKRAEQAAAEAALEVLRAEE